MPERSTGAPPSRVPLIIASICLAIAIVVPLLVGTYTRIEPDLAGIPFFYWYQFVLVIVAVILTSTAYRFVLKYERARRELEKREGEL